ncbi:MAG TPA: hypothetical protein VE226_00355 [Nitrososphaeraceae archaeon]|nr:hypothetical protein [Nitrososphaeraceae archaeon]
MSTNNISTMLKKEEKQNNSTTANNQQPPYSFAAKAYEFFSNGTAAVELAIPLNYGSQGYLKCIKNIETSG